MVWWGGERERERESIVKRQSRIAFFSSTGVLIYQDECSQFVIVFYYEGDTFFSLCCSVFSSMALTLLSSSNTLKATKICGEARWKVGANLQMRGDTLICYYYQFIL